MFSSKRSRVGNCGDDLANVTDEVAAVFDEANKVRDEQIVTHSPRPQRRLPAPGRQRDDLAKLRGGDDLAKLTGEVAAMFDEANTVCDEQRKMMTNSPQRRLPAPGWQRAIR